MESPWNPKQSLSLFPIEELDLGFFIVVMPTFVEKIISDVRDYGPVWIHKYLVRYMSMIYLRSLYIW